MDKQKASKVGGGALRLGEQTLRALYVRSSRTEKKAILSCFCEERGCHRKHAIRWFSSSAAKRREIESRHRIKIKKQIHDFVQEVWWATGGLPARKLRFSLPKWIEGYQEKYEALDDAAISRIPTLSSSTISRILQKSRSSKRATLTGYFRRLEEHFLDQAASIWKVDSLGFLTVSIRTYKHPTPSYLVTMVDSYSGWKYAVKAALCSDAEIAEILDKLLRSLSWTPRAVHIRAELESHLSAARRALFAPHLGTTASFEIVEPSRIAPGEAQAAIRFAAFSNRLFPLKKKDGEFRTANEMIGGPAAYNPFLEGDIAVAAPNPFDFAELAEAHQTDCCRHDRQKERCWK